MSRETTADFWGTLMRWIVALVTSATPVAALSGHDGTRPTLAPQLGVPARQEVLQEVLQEVPGSSRAARSVPVVPSRAWAGSGVCLWTLAGFGLPLFSRPSARPT